MSSSRAAHLIVIAAAFASTLCASTASAQGCYCSQHISGCSRECTYCEASFQCAEWCNNVCAYDTRKAEPEPAREPPQRAAPPRDYNREAQEQAAAAEAAERRREGLRQLFEQSRPAQPASPKVAAAKKACLAGDSAACSRGGGQPPEPQKPAPAKPDNHAAELAECLAQPITHLTVVRSNPFLAEEQVYQSLLKRASGGCAPPASWDTCMFGQAENALWSVDARVAAERDDMHKLFTEVGSAPGGPACGMMMGVEDTRAYCKTMSRENCIAKLQMNIKEVHCAFETLPYIWKNADARGDDVARKARDEECRRRFR